MCVFNTLNNLLSISASRPARQYNSTLASNVKERSGATNREEVDFQDEEMKTHRESDGADQPLVAIRRHHEQRLIL